MVCCKRDPTWKCICQWIPCRLWLFYIQSLSYWPPELKVCSGSCNANYSTQNDETDISRNGMMKSSDLLSFQFGLCVQDSVLLEPISSEEVEIGQSATFVCKLRAGHGIEFSWTRDGLLVKADGRIEVVKTRKSSMLSIESVQMSDRGLYTCVASNGLAEDRQSGRLTIKGS